MITEVKNTYDAIKEHFENLDDYDIVQAHNQRCENTNCMDDEIHYNDDEFFEVYFTKPIDAVRAANYGEYNYSDTWVKFNGYGNLESFDNPHDEIDIDEIVSDAEDNPQDYDIELIEVFECGFCGRIHEEEHEAENCCETD